MTKRSRGPSAQKRARNELIREEMRFLLQRDPRRFSKELLARILDEGCNLPLALARPIFYDRVLSIASDMLAPGQRARLMERIPSDASEMTHLRFFDAIRFLHVNLPDSEVTLARAAIEAVAAVLRAWRLDSGFFSREAARFDADLRSIITRISENRPGGRLASQRFEDVRRRLHMALTASLLRHIVDPDSFRADFGPVSDSLRDMQKDHAVFSRAMVFFASRTPYFSEIASRTFWRTLAALDTDYGSGPE